MGRAGTRIAGAGSAEKAFQDCRSKAWSAGPRPARVPGCPCLDPQYPRQGYRCLFEGVLGAWAWKGVQTLSVFFKIKWQPKSEKCLSPWQCPSSRTHCPSLQMAKAPAPWAWDRTPPAAGSSGTEPRAKTNKGETSKARCPLGHSFPWHTHRSIRAFCGAPPVEANMIRLPPHLCDTPGESKLGVMEHACNPSHSGT